MIKIFLFFICFALFAFTKPITRGVLCTTSDPDFAGYRYSEKIPYCKRNVSTAKKTEVMIKYGLDPKTMKSYQIDHNYPLGIGGSNHIDSLWPQPLSEAEAKDDLEQTLYNEMRSGVITQEEAVQEVENWYDSIEQQIEEMFYVL